jgi:ABC-type multidrug transport system ATPase subunit
MTQRLTIARATLHEPDILLFDEPYTGLDQEASALLDDLLRSQAAQGRTILMITHDLVHGLNLADRVVILNGGRIAASAMGREMEPAAFLQLYTDVTRKRRDRER